MFPNDPAGQPAIYSVSDLTAYIRAVLESNENLIDIWVAGEISNLSQPKSGHVYFTLKDINASLRCVIWREQAWRLKGALRDGMAVEAHGSISVYEQGGQYQLYVDGLRAAGEGLLYQEFLRLKAALEAEGLFDAARKRPLPPLPNLIGIVTSPTGAALQDMLNTLRARYPLARVVLAPTAVQGEDAPLQIVDALRKLNDHIHPDVIIVARGGGSLEDLWAFNDERVVRAVAASPAPVISGVGHETDFTLTDFAADLRAPTPTGAAVLAGPDINDLQANLRESALHLQQGTRECLAAFSLELSTAAHRLERQSPAWRVRQGMQRLDDLSQRLHLSAVHDLKTRRFQLANLIERLENLDPARVLRRGYALIQDINGALITTIKQVKLGQEINVQVADGFLDAQVRQISEKDRKGTA